MQYKRQQWHYFEGIGLTWRYEPTMVGSSVTGGDFAERDGPANPYRF